MKKIYLLLLATFSLAACSSSDDNDNDNIYLLSTTKVGTVQKAFLEYGLEEYEYENYIPLLKSNIQIYKAVYYTEYPKGTKVKASGVFFISDDFNPQYPTVVYTHGTITEDEAPSISVSSVLTYTLEAFLGMFLASSFNCAVLLPDYIGYGESASIVHPYIHSESLGQASFDFIKAFKEYADNENQAIAFNKNIFITGYSEGGAAAVALQKKIQETSNSDLNIGKTIAGSGPYDNVAFAKEFFSQTNDLEPDFLSSYLWALSMYKNDFAYSKSYDSIYSASDNTILKNAGYDFGYFHTEDLAINTRPSLLFRSSFTDAVLNDSDTEFLQILKQNSLTDFAPKDSLIFVYGDADDWVYPINTINAYNAMEAKGCKVKLYMQPGGDHFSTLDYYLEVVLDRLKAIEE